ncbi:MAG: energy transducer TonB [Cytophagales bacterium]|nr:energy transducer TonB [Cytophagales bacterium]
MEVKKYAKHDLTLKIGMFRNLGLSITLLLVILLFELPSGSVTIIDLAMVDDRTEELILIPPTEQPPPPKPKPQILEITVVANELEIEEEIEIELDVEITELTAVEEIVFTLPETPEEEAEEIFIIVEDQPEFPGGIQAFYKFVSEKLRYPASARRMGIQGRVYIEFTVDKTGSLGNIHVVKGIGSGCDKEAVRVLKLVPKFNPGKQRGKPVNVRMVVPIIFKLAESPL